MNRNGNASRSETILLLIPNLGRGGAQKVFHDQLAFYSQHFKTIGCVFNWDGAFETDRAMNIISLDVPAGQNIISKFYFFLKRVLVLRKIKIRYNISVAISHLEGADYVNICSGTSAKTICWVHGTKKFDRNISGIVGWFRKKILIPETYKRSELIVSVSQGIKKELVNQFNIDPSKVIALHNGIDVHDIRKISEDRVDEQFARMAEKFPVAITHCRLAVQKNLESLIRMAELMSTSSDIKCVIVGDGELRAELLQKASAVGLKVYDIWSGVTFHEDYHLYFLGHHSNPYRYLKRSTIYLLPSLWEGFPLSLCEAMACGLPVIASDCFTGPRELLGFEEQNENPVSAPSECRYGFLMPLPEGAESIAQWASTTKRVIADDQWLSVQSARVKQRAIDFDMNVVRSKWLDIVHLADNAIARANN